MDNVSGDGERKIEMLPIVRSAPGVFDFSYALKGYQMHFGTGQVRIFVSFGEPPSNTTATAYFDFDEAKVKANPLKPE